MGCLGKRKTKFFEKFLFDLLLFSFQKSIRHTDLSMTFGTGVGRSASVDCPDAFDEIRPRDTNEEEPVGRSVGGRTRVRTRNPQPGKSGTSHRRAFTKPRHHRRPLGRTWKRKELMNGRPLRSPNGVSTSPFWLTEKIQNKNQIVRDTIRGQHGSCSMRIAGSTERWFTCRDSGKKKEKLTEWNVFLWAPVRERSGNVAAVSTYIDSDGPV